MVSRRASQQQSIELVLQNVSPQVMLVLSMTDLDKVFAIKQQAQPAEAKQSAVESQPFTTHPSIRSRTKRAIDIVGSLAGLAITGILFVPLAIAIKIDDPGGPILFGQTRCSWMGRRFKIWKVRSMVSNAEALKHNVKNEADGAIFKNTNDPRITRVGRFIRKTSLDEFPQFWNVLKGDM
ncbi:MAG: sugar transferase, partial [Chloroflexota bacterium]